jgi:hypothetical protein
VFEPTVTGEVTGVFAERALIEVGEDQLSVDIVGCDTGLGLVTAVANDLLHEPLEFASCVSSVVSAVTTPALSLVLEVAVERLIELGRQSSIRHRSALPVPVTPISRTLLCGKRPREAVVSFVHSRGRGGI